MHNFGFARKDRFLAQMDDSPTKDELRQKGHRFSHNGVFKLQKRPSSCSPHYTGLKNTSSTTTTSARYNHYHYHCPIHKHYSYYYDYH